MNHVFIGLGSNIETPLDRLSEAYRHLTAHADLSAIGLSNVYVSSPQGPQDQPDFHNAVASFATSLSPHELLTTLLIIETTMGRKRLRHWGERCIDLDLLLYGTEVIATDALILPHPRAHERRFVLDPLSELLGTDYVMPGQPPLGTLLSRCTQQTISVLCEFPQ
jgi:2-amino-4-hydroxy-6-hydroxymethyldihydropteridine diphosphokinase